MMMKKMRLGLNAALFGLALMVTGCGNPADTPDTPQTPVTDANATMERPSKSAMRAEFEAALEMARATEGAGAPVMWTLADEDTTIHIFGTVHLLRPELDWRTPAFDQALAAADTIVFEVDMKSQEAVRAITTDFIARGVFSDGRTLTSILTDADEAVVRTAFNSIGVPLEAMNTFEPWMAAANLSTMKLTDAGYDIQSGVEQVIEAEAQQAGKSFAYLEQISQQADAFDFLPEEDQISMLYSTALMIDESPQMLDMLVDEWAQGDIAGLEILVANPDGVGFTETVYEAVLVTRNRAWIPQIESMLDQPGTTLIAVGAAHMAGPDSIIEMLRARGHSVEGP
jgi:uncharacterized protein